MWMKWARKRERKENPQTRNTNFANQYLKNWQVGRYDKFKYKMLGAISVRMRCVRDEASFASSLPTNYNTTQQFFFSLFNISFSRDSTNYPSQTAANMKGWVDNTNFFFMNESECRDAV